MADFDWAAVERKWQARWREAGLFEARAEPGRPKWFGNVPYPYMSGRLHTGFMATFLRAEIAARYRRMKGYRVLFPQAFHCTGLPILGAARRIAEGDERQRAILRDMLVPEEEIPRFADPAHWIETFPRLAKEDLQRLGAAVDWRRSFVTTSANPPYDRFVKWQFNRLRAGGYARLGRHPVVWCPKDQAPIGDHDRLKGEGESPVEFVLLKFPLEGRFLVAATLRPETVFGQTNLWVDPAVTYVAARVDGESWILNRGAVEKLQDQGRSVEVVGEVAGASLLGKTCEAPMIHRPIPILPSTFIDQGRGTGIVTSVPSDAPDDWIALEDLRRDPALLTRHGLDAGVVSKIEATPIIRSEGWGDLPAAEICARLGVRDQNDREKLERAKEEIYRTGFYTGVMRENCGGYAGKKVEVAKEEIKAELLRTAEASTLWEPSAPVVCRCATPARVKLVTDQWFLAYGDEAWKARAREALARMTLYPEQARAQLAHVVEWLRDWACAHHHGLGTTLPWDDGWVIESLSDSTVYMAYYTLAHVLQGGSLRSAVPWAAKVDDAFFDCVFLGQGDAAAVAGRLGIEPSIVEALRREFIYWYPFDLRNSGKDLAHNHMVFFVFNHAAIFPPELWPRGMGINGFVAVDGQKMSKSRGNTILIADLVGELGADVSRITMANGAEGLDDPNFDFDFAGTIAGRLRAWHAFATGTHRTRDTWTPADAWFRSQMNRAVQGATEAMEELNHRTALKRGYFDLQAAWEWYLQRCEGVANSALLQRFLQTQTLILCPFVPHLAEETWEALGGKGFASAAPYPEAVASEIDPAAEAAEAHLRDVLADTREILKVTGKAPRLVRYVVAPPWKVHVYRLAVEMAGRGSLDMKGLMAAAMEVPDLKARAGDLPPVAKKVLEGVRSTPKPDVEARRHAAEDRILAEAEPFLRKILGAEVVVEGANDALEASVPKARQALPWRPAILVE